MNLVQNKKAFEAGAAAAAAAATAAAAAAAAAPGIGAGAAAGTTSAPILTAVTSIAGGVFSWGSPRCPPCCLGAALLYPFLVCVGVHQCLRAAPIHIVDQQGMHA